MGWDAGLNRKLAVPLVPEVSPVLDNIWSAHMKRAPKTRALKESDEDSEDMRIMMKLADNRLRLERLRKELDELSGIDDSGDVMADLDYINASVSLELLEVMGELSELESSDELFDEAVA